jgi:hypothetical protein
MLLNHALRNIIFDHTGSCLQCIVRALIHFLSATRVRGSGVRGDGVRGGGITLFHPLLECPFHHLGRKLFILNPAYRPDLGHRGTVIGHRGTVIGHRGTVIGHRGTGGYGDIIHDAISLVATSIGATTIAVTTIAATSIAATSIAATTLATRHCNNYGAAALTTQVFLKAAVSSEGITRSATLALMATVIVKV